MANTKQTLGKTSENIFRRRKINTKLRKNEISKKKVSKRFFVNKRKRKLYSEIKKLA